MKIVVRNLGPLKEAEIDLRPLTIFVGPNNTGKTWLAYTLASIFGPLGLANYINKREITDEQPIYKFLEKVIQKVVSTGSASFDLVEFADMYGEQYFNDVARFIARDMHDFMGTRPSSFDDLDVGIDLAESKEAFLKSVLRLGSRGRIGEPGDLFDIRKRSGSKRVTINIYIQSVFSEDSSGEDTLNEEIASGISPDIAGNLITTYVLTALHRALYTDVSVLPTERTTFITFPFPAQAIKETRAVLEEGEEINGNNLVRMAYMVGNFLEMISKTSRNESKTYEDRLRLADSNSRIKQYLELAQLMENEILEGKVIFSSQREELSSGVSQVELPSFSQILFQYAANKDLEVSIASSMVKELSSLVLYLRYLARPGDLIVIDEPEMNLHPEAQMKMLEFLAMLINAGLRIIITTHSPYLIDHLTNLLKAYEAENKEEVCNLFALKRTDAFIARDNVSVYLFNEGKVKAAMDDEGIIDLDTFGDVSNRIAEIFFAL